MPQKPETRFDQKIRPLLEALPNTAVFKIQQTAIRGTPDLLLCVNGLFVALELKASEKSKPSVLQLFMLNKISDAKGFGLVVNPQNWHVVYEFLKQISEAKNVQTELQSHSRLPIRPVVSEASKPQSLQVNESGLQYRKDQKKIRTRSGDLSGLVSKTS